MINYPGTTLHTDARFGSRSSVMGTVTRNDGYVVMYARAER